MSLSTVYAIQNPPGLTLSATQSGGIVTTQWAGQPIFPTNLPVGFTCTIINYSLYPWTSNTLATPMFVVAGSTFVTTTSFTLQPGQSCVVSVVANNPNNNQLSYYIAKGGS
ncbi:MAG TPA: hypothetical protein VMF06_16015 [Candidatus Limnocylindria bacterium]|jgi:hypothetical protein|nr:hypothetical protein [Candidatus Limnocylindria bacterium]